MERRNADFETNQIKQDDQLQLLSQNDSVPRIHDTSAINDPTPRRLSGLTSTSRRSLLSQRGVDELSPFRQVSQDSAYESILGLERQRFTVPNDLQAAMRARRRVEMMRARVLQTRRGMKAERHELQWLRERLRDATDALMRAVNELMALQNIEALSSLAPYHEAMRRAQDELGPTENTYDLLELRLHREEEDLERAEEDFYTLNNIDLVFHPEATLDKAVTPHVIPIEPAEPIVPSLYLENELVQQYLGKVSEAEALKEQLRELESQHYELTVELSFHQRYDMPLSKNKHTLLLDFPQAHRELIDTLEGLEDNLYEIREKCVAKNLLSESDYPYEPYDAFVEDIYDSINDVRDQRPLHALYTRHRVDGMKNPDYVNTWLLEWIQESTLQTMLLKSFIQTTYPDGGKDLAGDEWSGLALEFWNQDSAGYDIDRNNRFSTIDALLGGTGSSLSLEDWGYETKPVQVSPSLSSHNEGKDVGIQVQHVERLRLRQGPSRRRRRASNSKAHSL